MVDNYGWSWSTMIGNSRIVIINNHQQSLVHVGLHRTNYSPWTKNRNEPRQWGQRYCGAGLMDWWVFPETSSIQSTEWLCWCCYSWTYRPWYPPCVALLRGLHEGTVRCAVIDWKEPWRLQQWLEMLWCVDLPTGAYGHDRLRWWCLSQKSFTAIPPAYTCLT